MVSYGSYGLYQPKKFFFISRLESNSFFFFCFFFISALPLVVSSHKLECFVVYHPEITCQIDSVGMG